MQIQNTSYEKFIAAINAAIKNGYTVDRIGGEYRWVRMWFVFVYQCKLTAPDIKIRVTLGPVREQPEPSWPTE